MLVGGVCVVHRGRPNVRVGSVDEVDAPGRHQPAGHRFSVDGADELTVHRPPWTLRRGEPGHVERVPTGEQPGRRQLDAGNGQRGNRVQQSSKPRPGARLDSHRHVRALAQDGSDQSRQHLAGTGLDEDPRTGRVHRLDLLDEAHGRADLPGELVADVAVGRCSPVGPDRYSRRVQRDSVEGRAERLRTGGDDRAVERAGDREALGAQACRTQRLDSAGHVVGRTRDHRLSRRVLVRGNDPAGEAGAREHRLDLGARGGDGGHGARVLACRREDRFGAGRAQLQQRREVEDARTRECDQLAVAVPSEHVGANQQPAQQMVDGQTRQAQRRLRPPGVADRVVVRGTRGVVERRRREDGSGVFTGQAQVTL